MKELNKINKKNIRNSSKYLIKLIKNTLFTLPIIVLVLHYSREEDWLSALEWSLGYSVLLIVGMAVLVLIVHLTHYYSNKELEVEIDRDEKKVKFIWKNEVFSYGFSELSVIWHLPVYHKNKVDDARRRSTPWSNYSFIEIITPDNKQFNVSSILLNRKELPVKAAEIKYSLWPSIGPGFVDLDLDPPYEIKRVQEWKEKFSHLTAEQIDSKLRNPKYLDEFPLRALRELKEQKV